MNAPRSRRKLLLLLCGRRGLGSRARSRRQPWTYTFRLATNPGPTPRASVDITGSRAAAAPMVVGTINSAGQELTQERPGSRGAYRTLVQLARNYREPVASVGAFVRPLASRAKPRQVAFSILQGKRDVIISGLPEDQAQEPFERNRSDYFDQMAYEDSRSPPRLGRAFGGDIRVCSNKDCGWSVRRQPNARKARHQSSRAFERPRSSRRSVLDPGI